MKILRVITSVNPQAGGSINGLINSSNLLIEKGYSIDVESLDDPKSSWVENFKFNVNSFKGYICTLGRVLMTEVGDNVAIYIEPEVPVQAAEIIHNQLHAEKDLTTKSIENAKRFSMKVIIASYTAGYKQAYSIVDESIK
jgi:hypothetical protein